MIHEKPTGDWMKKKKVKKKAVKRKKKSKLQKKRENPNSKLWLNKADKAWSELIRLEGTCAVNKGCSGNLEAHHLITRANRITRHEYLNGICLCSLHHTFSHEMSAHGSPLAFGEWLKTNRPKHYYFALKNRFKTDEKPNYQESYEDITKLLEVK
jgi:hypothetical protein